MGRLSEDSVVEYQEQVPLGHGAGCLARRQVLQGVIVAQGGAFGGWSLYAKDGKPKYCYNFAGLQRFYVEGDTAIPAGEHQVRMEFAYDGGGLGKGGTVTLYLDGNKVGEGRVEATVPMVFLTTRPATSAARAAPW